MSVTFYAADGNGKYFGTEDSDGIIQPSVNFNNGNASAILLSMGLLGMEDLYGELEILPFQAKLASAIRQVRKLTGGAIIRPEEVDGNFVSFGLDREGLLRRLESLEAFVLEAAAIGAKMISWS